MRCPQPPPPPPASSNLAGWILLGLLAGILIVDYTLYKTGRPTISQWLKAKTGGRSKWLKPIGIGLLGVLLYHLFFGGPL